MAVLDLQKCNHCWCKKLKQTIQDWIEPSSAIGSAPHAGVRKKMRKISKKSENFSKKMWKLFKKNVKIIQKNVKIFQKKCKKFPKKCENFVKKMWKIFKKMWKFSNSAWRWFMKFKKRVIRSLLFTLSRVKYEWLTGRCLAATHKTIYQIFIDRHFF